MGLARTVVGPVLETVTEVNRPDIEVLEIKKNAWLALSIANCDCVLLNDSIVLSGAASDFLDVPARQACLWQWVACPSTAYAQQVRVLNRNPE